MIRIQGKEAGCPIWEITETADMTVIVCTEWNGDVPAAIEIVGWYCGMPNDEDTEYYKDKGVRAVLE